METKVACLRIERRELASIKPHPRNPRKHPKEGSPAWITLQKSLEHDYFDPLVLNDRNGYLVSGHFRQKVMLASGFTAADVSVVDYDEPTHLARLIAANSLIGEFDELLLADLAKDIEASGLEAALAGWDEKQLARQLDGPEVQDDANHAITLISGADKIQAKWKVEVGDFYQIGAHRLLVGDCTAEASWKILLGSGRADMVWTDPPYNVDYDATQKHRIEMKTMEGVRQHKAPEEILNDHLSDKAYAALLRSAFQRAFEFTKPGGTLYVAHADSFGLMTRQAIHDAGWYLAQCLIWVKNGFTLGRQDHQWQHEPILYGWKPGAGHYWQAGFDQSSLIDDEKIDLKKATKEELAEIIRRLRNAREGSVIREARNSGEIDHPTVKPLPLVSRQLWNSSRRGDVVLELFGGSGTTLLAAEKTGRKAVATELSPKFAAVILQRLTDHGLTVEKIPNG